MLHKACISKWLYKNRRTITGCCNWIFQRDEEIIPSDVPKGHLAVYVGEEQKRYVVKVTLLKQPLFRALLDQAWEMYEFAADSRLCIPCDEAIFLAVVQASKTPAARRLFKFL